MSPTLRKMDGILSRLHVLEPTHLVVPKAMDMKMDIDDLETEVGGPIKKTRPKRKRVEEEGVTEAQVVPPQKKARGRPKKTEEEKEKNKEEKKKKEKKEKKSKEEPTGKGSKWGNNAKKEKKTKNKS